MEIDCSTQTYDMHKQDITTTYIKRCQPHKQSMNNKREISYATIKWWRWFLTGGMRSCTEEWVHTSVISIVSVQHKEWNKLSWWTDYCLHSEKIMVLV